MQSDGWALLIGLGLLCYVLWGVEVVMTAWREGKEAAQVNLAGSK